MAKRRILPIAECPALAICTYPHCMSYCGNPGGIRERLRKHKPGSAFRKRDLDLEAGENLSRKQVHGIAFVNV